MHGDLYAHNTLIEDDSNTIFGDFGAATTYNLNDNKAPYYERLDVRAFGYLIEDLLNTISTETINTNKKNALLKLKENCIKENSLDRPNFNEIIKELNSISNSI